MENQHSRPMMPPESPEGFTLSRLGGLPATHAAPVVVRFAAMRKYIPELDGLRGISVLLVITAHMHQKIWHWASGGLGVIVFFVLSGYLITSLALREECETGTVDLKAFYIRRAFRIFPLYYLVLALYCLLIFGLHQPEHGLRAALPYYLTYFQEIPYSRATSALAFYQSWSLGIEEKFYLVWPLLAFVIVPRFRIAAAAILVVAAVGLGSVSPRALYPYNAILIGCLLAMLKTRIPFVSLSRFWFVIATLVLALHLKGTWVTAYALSIAMLLGVVVNGSTPLNRVLSFRPLTWVGKVSYGVYLVHILCLNIAEKVSHNAIVAYALACLISVAVASALHLVIERRLIMVGRGLASHRKAVDGVSRTRYGRSSESDIHHASPHYS
jgi:peptidoglycan/LPS O-acetylase OafA/YrhL